MIAVNDAGQTTASNAPFSFTTTGFAKTYGGGGNDFANSIQQTSDGGYIVAGYTGSFGAGETDCWIMKLKSDGQVEWQKTYGGISWDFANSIQQTSDGGYIVVGYTDSFGAGSYDFWILKIDSNGNIAFKPASGASSTGTSAAISDTAVTPANTTVTGTVTTATVSDTNVTPVDTNATIVQQAP